MTSLDDKLKELLDYGNEFLDKAIGFHPVKSTIEIVPDKEWREHYPNDSWGWYNPVDMTSKVRETPNYKYMLTTAFHEYHGHGTFTECTEYGNRIRRAINTLEDMRRKAYENPELEEKAVEAFDEFREIQENVRPALEGFAVWVESQMSYFYGLEDTFRKKMTIMDPMYLNEFIRAGDYIEQYGQESYLRELGFKRMDSSA